MTQHEFDLLKKKAEQFRREAALLEAQADKIIGEALARLGIVGVAEGVFATFRYRVEATNEVFADLDAAAAAAIKARS